MLDREPVGISSSRSIRIGASFSVLTWRECVSLVGDLGSQIREPLKYHKAQRELLTFSYVFRLDLEARP